ncbi:hypothetical protein Tco_1199117 [Tanacetum coccineum]
MAENRLLSSFTFLALFATSAYRVFNKRTRVIVETIHGNFDELPQMASDQVNSDPVPKFETVTTSNELDLLFSQMFDELLNGTTSVVSKSSVIHADDAPNKRLTQLNLVQQLLMQMHLY